MISAWEILLRLFLGALFGGIIGFERETHGRPAGFRTHLLVCVASVLIMVVSEYYFWLSAVEPSFIRIDPARIAAGAITGVGFLGAGVILKAGMTVMGLTTAACIWMVSAIGLALGGGMYLAATAAFAITYVSLWSLRSIERRMPRQVFREVEVESTRALQESLQETLEAFGQVNLRALEHNAPEGRWLYRFTITLSTPLPMAQVLQRLSAQEGVLKVRVYHP
jgi:putative Mg2+ transporter-C (MgtC) family protein